MILLVLEVTSPCINQAFTDPNNQNECLGRSLISPLIDGINNFFGNNILIIFLTGIPNFIVIILQSVIYTPAVNVWINILLLTPLRVLEVFALWYIFNPAK